MPNFVLLKPEAEILKFCLLCKYPRYCSVNSGLTSTFQLTFIHNLKDFNYEIALLQLFGLVYFSGWINTGESYTSAAFYEIAAIKIKEWRLCRFDDWGHIQNYIQSSSRAVIIKENWQPNYDFKKSIDTAFEESINYRVPSIFWVIYPNFLYWLRKRNWTISEFGHGPIRPGITVIWIGLLTHVFIGIPYASNVKIKLR